MNEGGENIGAIIYLLLWAYFSCRTHAVAFWKERTFLSLSSRDNDVR